MKNPVNLEFPWNIFRVVLEGLSILDVPKLEVKSMEEATNFIQAYGYDASEPEDLELIWSTFDDAINFIEKTLTDPEYPTVPDHLNSRESIKDVRRLLLLCSQAEKTSDRLWACAILRVMHVLIHISHDPRLNYFDQVQNQILSRLDDYLYVDDTDGATYLGKKDRGERIKLLFFKKKDRKDRVREIIKLLHKSSATAEEIYDRIGFRLVTETKFDAICALRLLLSNNIISLPNIRPGRSRNWLVDIEKLQTEVNRFRPKFEETEEEEGVNALLKKLEKKIAPKKLRKTADNPYRSAHYHAVQFTCRELIKIKNPMHRVYSRLKDQLSTLHGGVGVLQEVFPNEIRAYEYVFFPYEIQIMDVSSYADSIFGKSNHDEYRRKQLDAARNRIFGRLVESR